MATTWIEWLLFGGAGFEEDEEYRACQHRFLIVAMVAAGLATAVLLVGVLTQVHRIASPHLHAMAVFTALSLLLWLALRGRPRAFRPVAYAYLIACQLEYVSALAIDIGDGKTLRVTASIGVASADRPGDTVGELHRHADAAMYRAKAAGRNRVSPLDSAALRPG